MAVIAWVSQPGADAKVSGFHPRPRTLTSGPTSTEARTSAVLGRFPEQGLDQRAVRQGPVRAPGDHPPEHLLHGHEVRDLRPDIVQVAKPYLSRLGARPLALVGQGEKCANLIHRKAQVPGPAYECQPLEVVEEKLLQ